MSETGTSALVLHMVCSPFMGVSNTINTYPPKRDCKEYYSDHIYYCDLIYVYLDSHFLFCFVFDFCVYAIFCCFFIFCTLRLMNLEALPVSSPDPGALTGHKEILEQTEMSSSALYSIFLRLPQSCLWVSYAEFFPFLFSIYTKASLIVSFVLSGYIYI